MLKSIISYFTVQFAKHPAGAVAGILQLTLVLVGLPSQILINYHAHSTAGMSGIMFILAGLANVAWSIHAWREIQSLSLLVPQIPAFVFTCVIVGQMICY